MLATSRVNWHDPALLAAGLIQVLTGPFLLLSLGSRSSDPGPWFVLGIWAFGIAVSGASVHAGKRLGWRHLLAIGPGLLAVQSLPRFGAIPALVGLGVVLLMVVRRKGGL